MDAVNQLPMDGDQADVIPLDTGIISALREELNSIARDWLIAITEWRSSQNLYGRVTAAIQENPNGSIELHLIELTTFRESPKTPEPFETAIEWLKTQHDRRYNEAVTGPIQIELDQKKGKITWVKITETTIISRK